MKKIVVTTCFLAIIGISNPALASGIPVVDALGNAQNLAESLKQLGEMAKQLQVARDQLSQAQRMYDSVTGIRGLGDLLRNPYLQDYLPSDMRSIYDAASRGGLDGIQGGIDSILKSEALNDALGNNETQSQVLQREKEVAAIGKAQGQKAYDGAIERLDQIESLMDEISRTEDQKAIDELQARLSGEQAAIQNELQKITLIQQLHEAELKLVEIQKDEAVRQEFDSSKTGMPTIR